MNSMHLKLQNKISKLSSLIRCIHSLALEAVKNQLRSTSPKKGSNTFAHGLTSSAYDNTQFVIMSLQKHQKRRFLRQKVLDIPQKHSWLQSKPSQCTYIHIDYRDSAPCTCALSASGYCPLFVGIYICSSGSCILNQY